MSQRAAFLEVVPTSVPIKEKAPAQKPREPSSLLVTAAPRSRYSAGGAGPGQRFEDRDLSSLPLPLLAAAIFRH